MKKLILIASLCFISTVSFSQNKDWAFGFRVGEPGGINVRKYLTDERAIELNIGTFGAIWGGSHIFNDGEYRNVGLSVNAHYLYLKDIGNSGRFRVHYGYGVQVNKRRFYAYRFTNPDDYENRTSIGASGTAGAEYYLKSTPLSIFADIGAFGELLPKPFYVHIQGGLGARFNF
jgi:hypothetical protein